MTNIAEQHKTKLRDYFDGLGFERWKAIYGDAEVSSIRRTIREGHATMLALAEQWIAEGLGEGEPKPQAAGLRPHVLDAGCGTGLFSLALARRGLRVSGVDIAPQMVAAAARAAGDAGLGERTAFRVGDLEHIEGRYDAVACLDVLIHYPQQGFAQLCGRLAGLSRGPLVLTYAPREPLLAALHWLGGRFPTNHRRTEIQMIDPRVVERALALADRRVRRSQRISRGFYHVTLLEAVHHSDKTTR